MNENERAVRQFAEDDPQFEIDASTLFGAPLSLKQFPDWVHETRTWGARSPQLVDLSGPTYPTQHHVEAGGLSHYLDTDVDPREPLYSPPSGDDPAEDVYNRFPNIVRQGGANYVLGGHHRVGATFIRGGHEVEGRLVDLDAHPVDSRRARGRTR